MPTCAQYCDKTLSVTGSTPTIQCRDDAASGGWQVITINELKTEMERAQAWGIDGAMHLKSGGSYLHFCPGQSQMTLVGGTTLSASYALGCPRTYACLHIVQPRAIWKMASENPEKLLCVPFTAIARARYSAWWEKRDPLIWKRTNIGVGHFPKAPQSNGQAIEIAINFCVDL